jgi:drug/metabolite transporter (DMT)-like permease
MMPDNSNSPGSTWLVFALLTVFSWGVYGVFLHTGQLHMADQTNGRYKAFLFVGLAYFLTAVLAPLALWVMRGASWDYPGKGMAWSLLAGAVGALGAFGVLLAFGAKGTPAVVMSIVFAGAPIVNALYSLWLHPPAGGFSAVKPQFVAGILLAALGGCLVTYYKPPPSAAKPPQTAAQPPSTAPGR